MTFYTDDAAEIGFVEATGFWVLFLNCKAVKDARRKSTLEKFVKDNSVPWERPTA